MLVRNYDPNALPMGDLLAFSTEGPVDIPDLGHVLSQFGAVRDQDAHLLHLGERSPVKIGAAYVKVSPTREQLESSQELRPMIIVATDLSAIHSLECNIPAPRSLLKSRLLTSTPDSLARSEVSLLACKFWAIRTEIPSFAAAGDEESLLQCPHMQQ